jgi:ankyrin repeat protein
MRYPPSSRRIVRAVTAAILAAWVLGGCAQHVYRTRTPSVDAVASTDGFAHYSEDWFAAARAGRNDILQALIDAHFPLETKTPEGYTALILAAYDGHADTLKLLLSAGADPCAFDQHGNTALMGALFKGNRPIATTLINTRCAIDQTNNAGETALSFAALFGRLDMLPVLVAHGANPNREDARGATALSIAIQQRNLSSADTLRQVGATQ